MSKNVKENPKQNKTKQKKPNRDIKKELKSEKCLFWKKIYPPSKFWKSIQQVLCNPVDKPTNKQTEVKHNCLGGFNNCYQPITAGVAMVSCHWLQLQVRGGNVNTTKCCISFDLEG